MASKSQCMDNFWRATASWSLSEGFWSLSEGLRIAVVAVAVIFGRQAI
ncbi:hypothetical protein L195_g064112, partial [Trifolium pratense]